MSNHIPTNLANLCRRGAHSAIAKDIASTTEPPDRSYTKHIYPAQTPPPRSPQMTSDYRVAIDIGTTKVCTIVTRQRADHRTELAGIGIVPCNGMSKGAVQDSSTVTEAVRKSVAIASEKAGVEIRSAFVGLTGNHVESKNRWANVP
ncbi:MAG: hypothetical protein VW271_07205, partial [Chloroflexota bacterium]